jgi:ATP-binding cassette subfamily E protein 1
MRIAVLLRDRCQPKRCNLECIKFCPRVRMGDETITIQPKEKPVIAEALCVGCGICVHKCPFEAIKIIGLAEELAGEMVHQFGVNGFRLYRMPVPMKGQVVGILGPNGIGKTTAINILSGAIVPNLGDLENKPSWEKVLARYKGTETHNYLSEVAAGRTKTAMKPQYVDKLPKVHKGNVRSLLKKVDETGKMEEVASLLGIDKALGNDIAELSGGELQRVAMAATMLKDADVYFFDEPSSYLDIDQRLKCARLIQALAKDKKVVVIEHDLAVLDFLAESVHLTYGTEGAYGVVTGPRPVRTAINVYLDGYLKEENIRFRDREIAFEPKAPRGEWKHKPLIEFGALERDFDNFKLKSSPGVIRTGEVVGVLGPNATGKTTFVKMLASELEPTKGTLEGKVKVSYKPQYIKPEFEGCVRDLFMNVLGPGFESGYFQSEIGMPLSLAPLWMKDVQTLSGGELQRVAIALCISQDAELYLIDEPSAYLDSNQRMEAAKTIRRVMENHGHSAMIVDHDVYFIDLVADSIMVFEGQSSVRGESHGPFPMKEGMNRFLKNVGITFRRDPDTHRPRINKEASRLDREQKTSGDYYYAA